MVLRAPGAEGGIGGVVHHPELLQPRQYLPQHLDALGRHLLAERCEACQRAAGSGEARNRSGSLCTAGSATATTGILVFAHHGTRRGRSRREQHIDGPRDELVDSASPRVISPPVDAHLDHDAAPLDIAEIGHRLAEGPDAASISGVAKPTKPTIGMRGCCAERERAATPPPHRSMPRKSRRFIPNSIATE